MGRIFDPNNLFFRLMGRLSDLMILNFMWIIFSIPIITIGASTTALYSSVLKLLDGTEGYMIKGFYKAFKEAFKKATVAWIGIFLSGGFLLINILFWIRYKTIVGLIMIVTLIFLLFIFTLISTYIFPILSKYNKRILDTIKASFFLSIKYLPFSILIILINLVFAILPIIFPFIILFMIFFGIAFCALFNSYFYRIIFNKINF